jgi:hypothetical protein
MKVVYLYVVLLFTQLVIGQELFVVTDPASNIPANSLSARMGNLLFKEKFESGYNYHLMPEVSYGLNKNLMFRGTAFISNRGNSLVTEGGSFFSKYRFYSEDDINSHFRLAAFGRYSFNNSDIHQEQIETMGHNTGFEVGLVATKLIHKVAISSSLSFERAFDNTSKNPFPDHLGNTATNYTLSIGKLMYPKTYTSFKQTNINLMLEVLGQTINENGRSSLDVIPAVQFIINSQARIDLAYRHEIMSSLYRTAPNGFYLNLEYNLYNVFKK